MEGGYAMRSFFLVCALIFSIFILSACVPAEEPTQLAKGTEFESANVTVTQPSEYNDLNTANDTFAAIDEAVAALE